MSDTVPERVARLEAVSSGTHEALLRIERGIESGFRELRGELQTLRGELRSEMQAMRSETHADVNRLDGKIDMLRSDTHADNVRLDGKIDALTGRIVGKLPSWWPA